MFNMLNLIKPFKLLKPSLNPSSRQMCWNTTSVLNLQISALKHNKRVLKPKLSVLNPKQVCWNTRIREYGYSGSSTARNRTHNLFRPKRKPIPLWPQWSIINDQCDWSLWSLIIISDDFSHPRLPLALYRKILLRRRLNLVNNLQTPIRTRTVYTIK